MEAGAWAKPFLGTRPGSSSISNANPTAAKAGLGVRQLLLGIFLWDFTMAGKKRRLGKSRREPNLSRKTFLDETRA